MIFDGLPKDDGSGRYDWITPEVRRASQAANLASRYNTMDYLSKYVYGKSISRHFFDLFSDKK